MNYREKFEVTERHIGAVSDLLAATLDLGMEHHFIGSSDQTAMSFLTLVRTAKEKSEAALAAHESELLSAEGEGQSEHDEANSQASSWATPKALLDHIQRMQDEQTVLCGILDIIARRFPETMEGSDSEGEFITLIEAAKNHGRIVNNGLDVTGLPKSNTGRKGGEH